MVEAKKLAVADRLSYLGDPRMVDNPLETLLSKEFAARRRREIDVRAARPAVAAGALPEAVGETTYLCVADAEGNVVSMITSLSAMFGCGEVIEGTGIMLNNRAGRGFTLEEGHPNCIAPGKRTMHTLMPSLALRDGNRVFNVRHTATVAEKVKEVADLMGLARQAFAGTAEAYRRLAEIKVDARLLSEFFGILIPDNPDAERTSRTQNTRDRLIDLFENDWRNNLPETRHTLWSAYNAITHFVDHVRGSDDKRLQSAWFGSGAQLKDLAFTEALKLAA